VSFFRGYVRLDGAGQCTHLCCVTHHWTADEQGTAVSVSVGGGVIWDVLFIDIEPFFMTEEISKVNIKRHKQ
jgi:hypothetical protein